MLRLAGAAALFLAGGLTRREIQAEATPRSRERTFIMIKPEGVHRGLVGEIVSRLEQRGLKLVGVKMLMPGRDHYKAHYAEHSAKPFYPGLVSYMASGPVVATCWEGEDVVRLTRTMLGESDPKAEFSTADVEGRSEEIPYAIKNQLGHPKTQRVISCPPLVLYGIGTPILDPFHA